MVIATTAAFVPLTALLLTRHMEYEISKGPSPFLELQSMCSKPCSLERVVADNKWILDGAYYYFVNNGTCGYTDVVSNEKELSFHTLEDGRGQPPQVYTFHRRDGCLWHDEGFFKISMGIPSCKSMYVSFACHRDGGVRLYVVFPKEGITDECYNSGHEYLRKAGLFLPKKAMRACVPRIPSHNYGSYSHSEVPAKSDL